MSLKYLNLGEVLNSLRVYKKLTIDEIANDICSVEDFTLYEKGEKYPTLEELEEISNKLNVHLSYFFDFSNSGRFNYVICIMKLIEKYKRKRDYKTIYQIIQKEWKNPDFALKTNKQYLLWHEGICVYYLFKDKKRAVTLLNKAIELTNPSKNNLSERELEILTSIAIIEKDDKNYHNALKIFLEAYHFLENLPHLKDSKVKLRVLYALAQLLTKLGKYDKSLKYSIEGIKFCISNESLYLFGELYYQTGENYIRIGEYEKGNEYLKKSISVFELQGNSKFVQLVKIEMEKLVARCC